MIPAPRLRLKKATGWFAAGQEVAAALAMLSDAAFKLYVFLCLKVDRHSARMVWEAIDLANLLQRDRQSVTDSLEELCRREVCIRHPDIDGRIASDRFSVEICDRFWPYEKSPVEEFGVDQNGYVRRVRQMLSGTACIRISFSVADERLAAILYRRGVTLVQLQRAIWLGCARKYVALLNGNEKAPMFITSLSYFFALVEEVDTPSVAEDYWKHMQSKVAQLERMWRSTETRETK
uniref:Uncharacterized protein n=2 Tax=Solibacter usitatus (strain Ellin6076) TaxID=234267 RepID=Q01TM4_SOLUE